MIASACPATADEDHDWSRFPVPADPGPGREWRLSEELSDEFNYQFGPTNSVAPIRGKWTNQYRGGWEGPGSTKWRQENVAVANGRLWIRATRKPGETKTFKADTNGDGKPEPIHPKATRLGCITSTETVRYPVYDTKDETGKRTGLNKPMHLIINMEAQDWNVAAGRHPSDDELKRIKDHTMLVDWLRVYKPVDASAIRSATR